MHYKSAHTIHNTQIENSLFGPPSRSAGHNAEAPRRARSFETTDGELACTGNHVEVVEGFWGSCDRRKSLERDGNNILVYRSV